ncbi:MAG: NAD-dependent epimerase/dehydratase family protein [Chitinophagaceae bacterium]
MVLVTGGTGFLGAYIIKSLVAKGLPVRAIRRTPKTPFFIPECNWQKVEWVEGDVLDVVSLQDAMEGVQGVIHSAAVVSFHSADRQLLNQVNIDGTANVVNAAIDAGVQRFIHVSSVAALGRSTKSETVNEERSWQQGKSHTHYAQSKHGAELEVWRGFAEGLRGAIINPSTILGFGNWHESSSALFKNVYRGFPWYSEGVNGFVGVEDAAEAAMQLLQSDIHGKRFIVNAENWRFQDLFNAIADGFGVKRPYRKATPFLGELAWRAEALKALLKGEKPLLTRQSARVAHSRTQFDNSALLKALPQFSYTPLQQVIDAACRQYLQAVKEGKLSV